jgi:hypothetical protein
MDSSGKVGSRATVTKDFSHMSATSSSDLGRGDAEGTDNGADNEGGVSEPEFNASCYLVQYNEPERKGLKYLGIQVHKPPDCNRQ